MLVCTVHANSAVAARKRHGVGGVHRGNPEAQVARPMPCDVVSTRRTVPPAIDKGISLCVAQAPMGADDAASSKLQLHLVYVP